MDKVTKLLERVMHPEINASLVELGIIDRIETRGDKVSVTMKLPFPGVPIKGKLIESIKQPLEKMGMQIEITTQVMNQTELQRFLKIEREKWNH